MFGHFGVFLVRLCLLGVFGLLTTENQWVFSGEEGIFESHIGEGHPSPLCPLFAFVFGLEMCAWLVLASFQSIFVVNMICYASVLGWIYGP